MHHVLVLGGEGMLGRMVVGVLSRSSRMDVEYTSRSGESGHFYDVEEEPDALGEIFEKRSPIDWVINCIGVVSGKIDERDPDSIRRAITVNALFPHNLARLSRRAGAQVIHISTDGVFSGRADKAYFEDAPHDCLDVYGKTKSLGEVQQPGFLNIRCSIIGPDPVGKKGLLEWFLAQPDDAVVHGYTDHVWHGVTTLQYAQLCVKMITQGCFQSIWDESCVHHFCPNQPVSKFELLNVIGSVYGKNLSVLPSAGPHSPVRRVLATRYQGIKELFPQELSMEEAVRDLAEWREAVD